MCPVAMTLLRIVYVVVDGNRACADPLGAGAVRAHRGPELRAVRAAGLRACPTLRVW